MSGIAIQVKVEDGEIKALLGRFSQRASNLTPVMNTIGQIIRTSVIKNFEEGGRPQKWQPSERAEREGGQTLIDSARLRNSIAAKASNNKVEVGTNVVYAAIHQFGGKINMAARSELFVRNRYKRGGKKGQFKKGTAAGRGHTIGAHSIPIPARPFLAVQAEDWTEIKKAITDHILKA